MNRSRKFCITINNYVESDFENMSKVKGIRGGIMGREVAPSTGTKHLQCYIQMEKDLTISALVKRMKQGKVSSGHISIAKGNLEQNIEYCSKEDKKPYKFGKFKTQGERSDWNEIYDFFNAGGTLEEAMEKYPEQYIKYANGMEKVFMKCRERNAKLALKEQFEECKLKDWQEKVVDKLEGQSDRQITWVYDAFGNAGKTWLAKYLLSKGDTFYCRNGKSSDIAYAYNYESKVVFDFTRSQQERINYGCIEAFKDGLLFSPKYASTQKIFGSCKVVVFANFYPDTSKLSQDRWDVMDLSTFEE